MRVYAETNFLLDLVFQQERFAASSFVLSLAQAGQIELCLPEIIVWEGNQKVERRITERITMIELLEEESREFGRRQEPLYQSRRTSLRAEAEALNDISELERERFAQIIGDLFTTVTWLYLSQDDWTSCPTLQTQYRLKQLDALIYATIRTDAVSHPGAEKCFISYDRIFNDPELKRDMTSFGITPLASTEAVTGFLQNRLDA